jgi:uncharacterized protein (DUF305 family)
VMFFSQHGGRPAESVPPAVFHSRTNKPWLMAEHLTGKSMNSKMISLKKCTWIAGLMTAIGAMAGAQMDSRAMSFMHSMEESMNRMDSGMKSAPMNGDIDHDFATMMMPHHQGAIDMAKAELSYGKDPVMRRLAEEIIVDQQSEIQAMRLWLSKQTPVSSKGGSAAEQRQ